jgi:osmotically-inducible protein OsmY
VARTWHALLALALLGPACGPKTSSELAGVDQEITRNIMWRYREDPAKRFVDVRVSCEGREIVIEGRVSDDGAARAALNIALAHARGGRVVSKLDVRPR